MCYWLTHFATALLIMNYCAPVSYAISQGDEKVCDLYITYKHKVVKTYWGTVGLHQES